MIEINFNWSIVDCEQSIFSLKIRRKRYQHLCVEASSVQISDVNI